MKQKGKGRKVFRTAVSMCILTLLVGGTFALLTALVSPRLNVFSFGKLDLEIDEEFRGWSAKEVALTNVEQEGAVDSVVRCMIFPVLRDSETHMLIGGDLGALGEPVDDVLVLGDFRFIFASDWEANWFYKDGFFYYRKVLSPGETTTLLLKKVEPVATTSEELTALEEKYEGIDIDVEVRGDIVQAYGSVAFDKWGVTVTGTTVSP